MAKRNPDNTGSEAPKAPERRRRTTAAEGTGKTAAPAKPRGRRKTDVTAEVATAKAALTAAVDTAPTQLTAGGAFEAPAASATTTGDTHAEGGNGRVSDVQVPHEYVALRAYHLYLERGGQPGDQFQDWVTAERQLREQLART